MAWRIAKLLIAGALIGMALLDVAYRVIYLSAVRVLPTDETLRSTELFVAKFLLLIVVAVAAKIWLNRHPDPDAPPAEPAPRRKRGSVDKADARWLDWWHED